MLAGNLVIGSARGERRMGEWANRRMGECHEVAKQNSPGLQPMSAKIRKSQLWWGEAPGRPVSGCEELRPVESPDCVRPTDAPSRGPACCS